MRAKRTRHIENPKQYIGQKFNDIEVLSIYERSVNDLETACLCRCHCGQEFAAPLWRIISNVQKSCGMCGPIPSSHPIKVRKDLTGQVFGELTVTGIAGRNTQGRITYSCRCSCGNQTIVASNNLTSGNTKSCGRCNYARSTVADAMRIYETPEEAHLADCVYGDMKRRCYDPKFPEYAHYGARGITMCDEWLKSPKAYVDWCMSHGWKPGLSVDRKDNNKGYSPENCRIGDNILQANNKRNNRRVVVGGVEHTVADWARITGINYNSLRAKTDEGIQNAVSQSLSKNTEITSI